MPPQDRPSESDILKLSAAIDAESALQRLGNDRELFNQIVQIYLEDVPELLRATQTALAASEAKSLRRAAHSLKGLAATMGARAAVSAAFRLEQIAGSGNLAGAAGAVDQLVGALAEASDLLKAYQRRGEEHVLH